MVVDNETSIPNAEIEFAITPGTGVDGDATHLAVLPGPSGADAGSVTFAPGNTTYTSLQTGDDVSFDTSTQKYAKQTGAVDLSGVTFTEPGVYRYELTETNPNISGMTADSRTLYLDVYVTYNNSDELEVTSTVLHTSTAAPAKNATSGSAGGALADKVTGFTNTYSAKDLEFSKTVSGNQASKDKYFAFTVTISNATAGQSFPVDLSNADANISANSNAATTAVTTAVTQPDTLTVGQDGTVSQVYYLHDGQSVKVEGLTLGAEYSVVEAQEDYTPSAAVTGDVDDQDANEAVIAAAGNGANGSVDADDAATISVAFTNTKAGVIPTGVLLTIAPFAVGILLFGAVIFFVVSKRRRDNY